MDFNEHHEREWFENVRPTGNKVADTILLLAILATAIAKIVLLLARPAPTFRCNDGTFSWSSNSRGACSWHNGTSERP